MTRNFDSFDELFERATGFSPFPYQARWAGRSRAPARVSIPTGLGKTAGAILSWVWHRRFAGPEVQRQTPRRLVYCLPMRVLVEQTHDCARSWLAALDLLAEHAPDKHPPDRIGVHVLMGGEREVDWDHWPDRDQILIGTQDMLLSRALNRGYAMSRFRWPVQFALLNNDSLWVMDEIQLMGNGLATTAQLQAFRRLLGVTKEARSVWMSATMRPQWLETVDLSLEQDAIDSLELEERDREHPQARTRLEANKPITRAPVDSSKDGKAEAKLILEEHATGGGLTLVVVNTVARATAIHQALSKLKPDAELVLVHSHFRPPDRKAAVERLLAEPGPAGTIAVSTQVVEAGVDVSARRLYTDLAPWASLVQRFGRCNRKGELEDAHITWLDVDTSKKGAAAPYESEELDRARELLVDLEDAAPARLPAVTQEIPYSHVVRRRDLIELLDTTPDLAGADIDVSRFIREADEHNVQIFWRELEKGATAPPPDLPQPQRDELCPVPLGEAREFYQDKSKNRALWAWDHLEREWHRPPVLYPGMVLFARAADGGYHPELGWRRKEKKKVPPVEKASASATEANDSDPLVSHPWQTLVEHTDLVVTETEALAALLDDDLRGEAKTLALAARWHDVGKAHPVFQGAIVSEGAPPPDPGDDAPPPDPGDDAPPHNAGFGGVLWAKAPQMSRYARRGFRHELASALAMLQHGLPDLAAYLAAAHHGKVRLSIRSLPHERPPADPDHPDKLFARGVHHGDVVPPVDLGAGQHAPETPLDLSYMELGDGPGGPSWLARTLALRDRLGPFRLAFLEALLRVADWRASASDARPPTASDDRPPAAPGSETDGGDR